MYKILVVVDMQKDFVDGALGFEGADKIIPGIISKIKEYEDDGRLVRTHYYSPSGSVTACKSGYSVLEQYYDEAGTLTGEAYFDTSGNRVTLKGGWCGYNIEVQSDGTKVKHYYNTAGTIVKSQ